MNHRRLTIHDLIPSQKQTEECGLPYVAPRKGGYVESDGGDAGYSWAVYSRSEVERAFGEITPENASDIAGNLTGWGESYSGPGRGFSCAPSLFLYRRNILIKRFSELDI